MTAAAVRSAADILGDAFTELGGHGGAIDVPTARHRVTQVAMKLDQIAAILSGDVPVVVLPEPECDCEEFNVQNLCCQEYEDIPL